VDQAASAGICEERDATRAIGYYWHCARGAGGDDGTWRSMRARMQLARYVAHAECLHVRSSRLPMNRCTPKGAHASVRILRASAPSEPPLRGVKKLHSLGRRHTGSVGVRRPLTVCISGCRWCHSLLLSPPSFLPFCLRSGIKRCY